ncbi:aspartate/tyrosine/aromatic aminotransferase [Aciduliprofundum sp. MAR08-339]|uniref:pyridoxal phosphate-dependent aminotransferase n=1 Tax=Aciduliprofundum sp. (strain MAR08-339) TaxID=673860 RepID=UPI0002A4B660|nr:aspartate/tyrosine/aromatic aminotransferase [Aciduliprofundum sp. MAR08-339]
MIFSKRIQKMAPSSTLSLVELANKFREKGYNIISMAVGEPDFTTPSSVIEAAYEAMKNGKTHYTPPTGISELREAIAEKYRVENGVNVDANNVIVTPAKLGIFMAVSTFIDPGDEVLIPDPGWVSYREMVNFARGKPVGIRLVEEKHFTMDIDDLVSKINFKTKVLIINSPSNPTGSILTYEDLKAIRDVVVDFDLILISDEIYEKIIYEGEHISPGVFEDLLNYTVIINGFSKSHAMTGWRIGYLIAPHSFIPQLEKMQQHTISCAPSMAQYAALQALKEKEAVHKMVEEFRMRRNFVYEELSKIEGLHVKRPKGTFYIFPRYDFDLPSKVFAEELMIKKQVAITPGSAFGPHGEGYFRLSFATSMENLKEGIKRLREFIEEL